MSPFTESKDDSNPRRSDRSAISQLPLPALNPVGFEADSQHFSKGFTSNAAPARDSAVANRGTSSGFDSSSAGNLLDDIATQKIGNVVSYYEVIGLGILKILNSNCFLSPCSAHNSLIKVFITKRSFYFSVVN